VGYPKGVFAPWAENGWGVGAVGNAKVCAEGVETMCAREWPRRGECGGTEGLKRWEGQPRSPGVWKRKSVPAVEIGGCAGGNALKRPLGGKLCFAEACGEEKKVSCEKPFSEGKFVKGAGKKVSDEGEGKGSLAKRERLKPIG